MSRARHGCVGCVGWRQGTWQAAGGPPHANRFCMSMHACPIRPIYGCSLLPLAGGCFSPQYALHGDLAQLRIWDRVLTK